MGLYDIESKKSKSCKLTLIDLCRELVKEYEDKFPNEEKNWKHEETLRKSFKNHDQSGLINKLKEKLSFDIEVIADKSDEEKFAKLKLLKLLNINGFQLPKWRKLTFQVL